MTRRNSNRHFALETYEPDLLLTAEKEQTMSPEQCKQSGKISRRKFRRTVGLSIVVSGTSSVLAAHAQQRFVLSDDRFGHTMVRPSYRANLAVEPRWRPTLPTRSGRVTGDFKMIDFLTFAGVDPVSRGQ
jgi:hypothetical protein